MVYRAVNSCLVLVPQVDGLPVITVEGLAQPDGTLHSVQQALVDADATQCGFCTPGFAMAMFAFAQRRRGARRRDHPRGAGRQSLPLHRLSADRGGLPHHARRSAGLRLGRQGRQGRVRISRRVRSFISRRKASTNCSTPKAKYPDAIRARRRHRSRHPRVQGARGVSGRDLDPMGQRRCARSRKARTR